MNFKKSGGSTIVWKKITGSTLAAGFGMWITGGLWHNLVLPSINDKVQAHHEGLGITLIAYIILALLMTLLYAQLKKGNKSIYDGLKLGVFIGVLWVFPHGLAMAGTHSASILYEIKNTFYHMFEQGVGGVLIFLVHKFLKKEQLV